MKSSLLKQTALLAVISCSLGILVGCASSEQEDIVIVPDCYDEAGIECVMVTDNQTGRYLPDISAETYTVTTTETVSIPEKKVTVISSGASDLAQSKPAGDKGVSVKDKPKTASVTETTTSDTTTVVETTVIDGVPVISAPSSKIDSTSSSETEGKKTQGVAKKSALSKKVTYGEECHDWEATAGSTLRTLLMEWGDSSGWTVIWKLERDYNLEAGVVFRGTFTEVSAALIRSFARATPAPIGTFYKGNRVLVINTQEDENAD